MLILLNKGDIQFYNFINHSLNLFNLNLNKPSSIYWVGAHFHLSYFNGKLFKVDNKSNTNFYLH